MSITNTEQDDQAFLKSIQNETKIFKNIGFIIEKMETEGNFKTVKETFTNLFGKEVLYTIKGPLTRTPQSAPLLPRPEHHKSTGQQHFHLQREPQNHRHENQ